MRNAVSASLSDEFGSDAALSLTSAYAEALVSISADGSNLSLDWPVRLAIVSAMLSEGTDNGFDRSRLVQAGVRAALAKHDVDPW